MASAVSVHAPAGFFNAGGGFEHPGLVGWTAASLGLAGPGRFSLDHVTGHCLNRPWVVATAFAAAATAAALVIRGRSAGGDGQNGEQTATEPEEA